MNIGSQFMLYSVKRFLKDCLWGGGYCGGGGGGGGGGEGSELGINAYKIYNAPN